MGRRSARRARRPASTSRSSGSSSSTRVARRDTSFIFTGSVTGGELEPQLGEIAEVGWLSRDEIARSSPGLHRLLGHVDAGGPYLGLD